MIIGITGGIGSGKSTIAKELAKRGYTVYDCDREAKRIIDENTDVQTAIINLLGNEAFLNGQYNTAYVAQRVFAEPHLLEALNNIIHPKVKEDILNRSVFCQAKNEVNCALAAKKSILFIESAILFEAGLDTLCDKVIVVEAPEDIRITRVIARDYNNNATPENINKVRARMLAQQKTPVSQAAQGKILRVCNDGSLVLSRVIDLVCDIAAY